MHEITLSERNSDYLNLSMIYGVKGIQGGLTPSTPADKASEAAADNVVL